MLATDEIAGRHFELVKLTVGADGVDGGMVADDNPLPVRELSDVATRTSVPAAAVNTLLLATSASRRGAIIVNDSSATLRIGLGTVAVSANDYTVAVGPGGYWELPYGFRGQVRGIWEAANGSARITVLT